MIEPMIETMIETRIEPRTAKRNPLHAMRRGEVSLHVESP
jgi:hypothetical protein